MKLPEAAREAIRQHSPRMAAGVAEVLRSRFGMNYAESAAKIEEWTGADASEWEELLYEADSGQI